MRTTDFSVNNKTISVLTSDITYETTDAIVNAAKSSLSGGGGVDGAIHRHAGRELLKYCKGLGRCPSGTSKLTPGFKLQAKFIIHTVGPLYIDGKSGEQETLASAYRSALEIADNSSLKSIAFPSISTGHYRFPIEEASKIAVRTIIEHLKGDTTLELVRFVLYGGDYEGMYIEHIKKYL